MWERWGKNIPPDLRIQRLEFGSSLRENPENRNTDGAFERCIRTFTPLFNLHDSGDAWPPPLAVRLRSTEGVKKKRLHDSGQLSFRGYAILCHCSSE